MFAAGAVLNVLAVAVDGVVINALTNIGFGQTQGMRDIRYLSAIAAYARFAD